MPRVDELMKVNKEAQLRGEDDSLIAWVNAEGDLELDVDGIERGDIPRFQKYLNEWYGEAK